MMVRAIIGKIQIKEELADKLESIAHECKAAAAKRIGEVSKENEEG